MLRGTPGRAGVFWSAGESPFTLGLWVGNKVTPGNTEQSHKVIEAVRDGQRTFGQIITELQTQFGDADPAKIRDDIGKFLEQLRQKRIVDY